MFQTLKHLVQFKRKHVKYMEMRIPCDLSTHKLLREMKTRTCGAKISTAAPSSFSTMMHLFILPTDILAHVLFPFLTITDVSQLDIAATNKLLRPQFAYIYPALSLSHLSEGITSDQMAWICKRSLRLESIKFNDNLPAEEVSAVLCALQRSPKQAAVVKHMRCSKYMHAQHFSEVLKCCGCLQSLDLSGCKNVDTALLTQVGELCPDLRALDLSETEVRDEAVISLFKHCSALTSVSLRGCSMQDRALLALAQHCPQLSSLDLRGCYPEQEVVVALAKHCSSLTSISVGGYHLTDSYLRAFARKLRCLTALDVAHSDNITDASVIEVTQNSPDLTYLDLSYCEQLTDTAIVSASRHCPRLSSLLLHCCSLLTDEALLALASNCPQMTRLDIRWCHHVTITGLQALWENCPLLVQVEAGGCSVQAQQEAQALWGERRRPSHALMSRLRG